MSWWHAVGVYVQKRYGHIQMQTPRLCAKRSLMKDFMKLQEQAFQSSDANKQIKLMHNAHILYDMLYKKRMRFKNKLGTLHHAFINRKKTFQTYLSSILFMESPTGC